MSPKQRDSGEDLEGEGLGRDLGEAEEKLVQGRVAMETRLPAWTRRGALLQGEVQPCSLKVPCLSLA